MSLDGERVEVVVVFDAGMVEGKGSEEETISAEEGMGTTGCDEDDGSREGRRDEMRRDDGLKEGDDMGHVESGLS